MKKIAITVFALIITISVFAQESQSPKSPVYYQKMGESLAQFGQSRSIEDFNTLSNQFVMISNVEKEEWLPLYYATQCKIMMSFMENTDKVKKEAYLTETEKWFEKMQELAPEESEVFALKALYYTAGLTIDPMTRGQEYSMLSNKAAGKALALNIDNPRAKYILLANKIGFAQFFGKEITAECEEANTLLSTWDDYKLESQLHPQWGKNRVEAIVKSCKK